MKFNGLIRSKEDLVNEFAIYIDIMKYNSLISAIPSKWKQCVKKSNISCHKSPADGEIIVKLCRGKINVLSTQCKDYYKEFVNIKIGWLTFAFCMERSTLVYPDVLCVLPAWVIVVRHSHNPRRCTSVAAKVILEYPTTYSRNGNKEKLYLAYMDTREITQTDRQTDIHRHKHYLLLNWIRKSKSSPGVKYVDTLMSLFSLRAPSVSTMGSSGRGFIIPPTIGTLTYN